MLRDPHPSISHRPTELALVPDLDRNGLEYLDRSECLQLLREHNFGRVGITLGALPTVLPITYKLVDERIIFRTGTGQKLTAATSGAVIAFEIDEMDGMAHSGWSVVVTGLAREVTDPDELRALDRIGVPRWAPIKGARTVALQTDVMSGRRLNPVRLSGSSSEHGSP